MNINTQKQAAVWALQQAMAVTMVFRLLTFATAPSLAAAAQYDPSDILLDTSIASIDLSLDAFVASTNTIRSSYGIAPLIRNEQLDSAAEEKLEDMAKYQYWSHVGPQQQQAWDFMKAAGYNYAVAGENLARGFTTARGITAAWYASPSHRENILESRYREVGFARGYITNQDGERVLVTVQLFGSR
jgi:uncharacterized protein YkwD